MGSRKLYAVRGSDMKESKWRSTAKNLVTISSSDSNGDVLTPLIRRKRTAEAAKLVILSNDIKQVKENVFKIFRLTNSMTIPLGLRQLLCDTFKCSICRPTPMVPPIIFAKCCKSILGCQQCVDTWYRGEEGQTRTCPKCRSDRAYVETCKVNGLDEFLIGIAPLLDGIQDGGDDIDQRLIAMT